MRKLSNLLIGILLGGGTVFLLSQYHLIRANDGFHMIPRQDASYVDVCVDVRNWDASKWHEHSELMRSLIADGRDDLIVEPLSHELLNKLFRNLKSDDNDDDE